jgi:hypothetical protein
MNPHNCIVGHIDVITAHHTPCCSQVNHRGACRNWVAAAGLTGGRLNLFNITKQSKVLFPHASMC